MMDYTIIDELAGGQKIVWLAQLNDGTATKVVVRQSAILSTIPPIMSTESLILGSIDK